MTVDCDLRIPPDGGAIARYTDPVWDGWHPIIPSFPYRLPADAVTKGTSYEDLRDDVLDPQGVDRAVLCGTLHPGNAVTQFEYHAAFTRAYNDWLAGEWLDRDERLYGTVQVMSQVPEEAAREIDRWADHPRMLQVALPVRGGEGYGLERYRPIFEAAARHDFVVALVQSASTQAATGFPEGLAEWQATRNQSFMGQALSLVFSGVFDEHPGLKVLLVGGGWTWLPYLMWTMDSNYRPLRAEVPWLRRLPSEVVPGHLYFTAGPVPKAAPPEDLRDMIAMAGFDRWLVWGSGYPDRGHSAPEALEAVGLDEALRERVLQGNAAELYGPRLERAGARAG